MKKEEYFQDNGVIFFLQKPKKRAAFGKSIQHWRFRTCCDQIFNLLIFIPQYMSILNVIRFVINFWKKETYHWNYIGRLKQSVQFFTLSSSLRTQCEMYMGLINNLNVLR